MKCLDNAFTLPLYLGRITPKNEGREQVLTHPRPLVTPLAPIS